MLKKEKFQKVLTALLNGEDVETFDDFKHDGFKLNSDKKYVLGIINGIKKCNLHCPCKIQKIEENLCPCDEFIETKHCHCKLWVKIEEE